MSAPPPLDTGTHCALASCGTSDFLPLTCAACSRAFCREHAAPSAHNCPAERNHAVLPAADLVKHAGTYGPELRKLLPDRDRVKRASEAVQVSDEERAKRARQQSALDKLRQAAEAKKGAAQTPSKTAAAVKKVSPVLELARLKGRAVPADPKHVKRAGDVAMPDRHFLTTITAGRALDLFAALFKVVNVNNETTDASKLLSLASSMDPPTRLGLAQPLSAQVANGGKVVLLKGFTWS
ncbi:hypothetical protein Rhopal_000211-T1 [Rhodotorula paludigena]|uniref:AN1-type domain-containing protein n=1 Tax=Rhodotorula paludigena TaxID=86838 RepID=A0AAV5GF56_9BASI|nr:hypothetical protein Rhopal_000211-T1 [Rhodotorula paludigena]